LSSAISQGRTWLQNPAYGAFRSLTGAQIRDVDLERARFIASREGIENMLRGQPAFRTYERVFVPQELRSQMTPAQDMLYRTYVDLQRKEEARKKLAPAR